MPGRPMTTNAPTVGTACRAKRGLPVTLAIEARPTGRSRLPTGRYRLPAKRCLPVEAYAMTTLLGRTDRSERLAVALSRTPSPVVTFDRPTEVDEHLRRRYERGRSFSVERSRRPSARASALRIETSVHRPDRSRTRGDGTSWKPRRTGTTWVAYPRRTGTRYVVGPSKSHDVPVQRGSSHVVPESIHDVPVQHGSKNK